MDLSDWFKVPKSKQTPTLGFLNLCGDKGQADMEADRAALADLFARTEVSNERTPRCTVLFLYCSLTWAGSIVETQASLRDVIAESGAVVVVVASACPAEYSSEALRNRGHGLTNIVTTIDRRGALFPAFFRRLFTLMLAGRTMPVAWVELAPQGPRFDHNDLPDTLYVPETGQTRIV